jgi:apolipoprotein N-acyltransferase
MDTGVGRLAGSVRRRLFRPAALLDNDRPLGLATGVLFFLALDFQLFPSHLVFLVPLLAAMERAPSLRVVAHRVLFATLVCSFLGAYWLLSLVRYSALAPIIYLLGPGYHAVCMAAPLVAAEALRRRSGWPIWLILPPLMVIEDYLFGLGAFRFTVSRWSHGLSYWPSLLQFTEWTGSLGPTAWVITVNTLVYQAWRSWRKSAGRVPAGAIAAGGAALALTAIVPLHGSWRMAVVNRQVAGAARSSEAVAVQPNIDLFDKHDRRQTGRNMDLILGMLRQVPEGADLVALPEATVPGVIRQRLSGTADARPPSPGRLAGPPRELSYTLLAGTFYARMRGADDYDLYNAALLIGPDGRVMDWNAKTYLLPFIEGLPILDSLGVRSIRLGTGGLFRELGGQTSGDLGRPLVIPGGVARGQPGDIRLGVIVCSEAFHPDFVRALVLGGAELLACISEDTWYASSPAFVRYLSRLVVARCIETRRACVRAANTGISGFVTPDGVFHDATPQWVRTTIGRRLPLLSEQTFYVRHGDWPVLVSVLWAGVVVLAALLRGTRREVV